jgi:hypothetical protein
VTSKRVECFASLSRSIEYSGRKQWVADEADHRNPLTAKGAIDSQMNEKLGSYVISHSKAASQTGLEAVIKEVVSISMDCSDLSSRVEGGSS